MKNMDMKALNKIGWVAIGIGFAASVLGAVVSDKKTNLLITDKVQKEVQKQNNTNFTTF